MGWKTLLTVVKDATVADLAPLGETVSADAASAAGLTRVMSAVEVDDDLLVIGGVDPDFDLAARAASALETEVVSARFMSVVDYYGWIVHTADGERDLECGEGEVVVDRGTPLPEESGGSLLDEDELFRIFTARTGIALDEWVGATAQVLRRTPLKKRRGLFRRRR